MKLSKKIYLIIAATGITVIVLTVFLSTSFLSMSTQKPAVSYVIPADNTLSKSLPQSQIKSLPSTVPVAEVTTARVSPGWDVSKNSKYGFEIQHPANSIIINHQDLNFQFTRIQNYNDKDISEEGKLARGKYYLEILVFDHKLGHKNLCEDSSMENSRIVSINGVNGYKGTVEGDPHATKIVLALCVSKSDVDYYLKAYEDQLEVAERIIDSFKFTN